jgi:hypothetical protein
VGLFHRDKNDGSSGEDDAQGAPVPGVSLEKVTAAAPGLVSLYKTAALSLEKYHLAGQRASVYLVLDHSGSMRRYYQDGSVQRLAEQVLAVSAHLDDDGIVPTLFFSWKAHPFVEVGLTDYQGRIDREQRACGAFGTTDYAAAIEAVVKHYRKSKAKAPAFVVFQTDGEPDSRPAAEQAIRKAAKLPIFWQFVGFGNHFEFLRQLDTMTDRPIDNAGFFPVGGDPAGMPDQTLLNKLMTEDPQWLKAARELGIVR